MILDYGLENFDYAASIDISMTRENASLLMTNSY